MTNQQVWTTSEDIGYLITFNDDVVIVSNIDYDCRVGTFDNMDTVKEYFEYYLGVQIMEIIDV